MDDTPAEAATTEPTEVARRYHLVMAIIQPIKLTAVREALNKIGVTRLSVADAQGFARQRGQTETYRGQEYQSHLLRKVAIEIVVNDDFLDRTIDVVQSIARSSGAGAIGDGKILVLPVNEVIRIRDGKQGPEAV